MEGDLQVADSLVDDKIESSENSVFDNSDSESDEVEVITKTSQCFSGNLLASMMKLKCDGAFCDVTIKSEEFIVKAHRLVLSSATEYFKAMFLNDTKEAKTGFVEFPEMSPELVKQCIEFIYSGKVNISMKIVRSLLDAAEMLQLPDLSELCVDFLAESVNLKSCADILTLSNLYNKTSLKKSLIDFLTEHFEEFSESDDFIYLGHDAILFCLELVEKKDEDCEVQKWKGILAWTNANLEERKCYFPTLFRTLHLHHLPKSFLKETIWSNELVNQSVPCLRLIGDVYIESHDAVPKFQPSAYRICFTDNSEVYHASVGNFPQYFSQEYMDVLYCRGKIYVGTGLNIYLYSQLKRKWIRRVVDLSRVTANEEPKVSIDLEDDYVDLSNCCYSRCIEAGESIYMLTRNYVIEFNIRTTKILHHNVFVGLGKGFFITASQKHIYAIGGDGTGIKAVAFDLTTKTITHLARRETKGFSFGHFQYGRAIFIDGQLHATDKYRNCTECYDAEANKWNASSVKISIPSAGVYFEANSNYTF